MKRWLKTISIIAEIGILAVSLSACSPTQPATDPTSSDNRPTSAEESSSDAAASLLQQQASNYPDHPTVGSVTADADTVIRLSDEGSTVTGSGASVSGSTVTVTASGTYLLSGTLTDGQLRVELADTDEDKVVLLLNGVSVTCADSAALYVLNASKKVVLRLADGSVNLFRDGDTYADTSEDAPTAAVFSKEDLSIDGTGTLYVTGNYNKGIFSKDDLDISDGDIFVTAVDDGIRGKDSVTVTGGSLTVTAGADALRSSNDTDADKGTITITGGTLNLTAAQDGIQAETTLTIGGGDGDSPPVLTVQAGGGANNGETHSDNMGGGMGDHRPGGHTPPGGGWDMGNITTDTSTDTTSCKALKATTLIIEGGDITVDAADDALHANADLTVSGGRLYLESGDDGMHAEETLTVAGGNIEIARSYEGVEAKVIRIQDGTLRLTSSDDGFNATDGTGRDVGGMFGGMGNSESAGILVEITGGYVMMNASGDGLDSNESVTMSGGTVIVYGPTNSGNGALDYASSFTLTGGWLLAVGSAGMAQSVTGDGQEVLAFTASFAADTLVNIADSTGESMLTVQLPKSCSCVIFSGPLLRSGETYTVSTGGNCDGENIDGVYSGGSCSGGTELGTLEL